MAKGRGHSPFHELQNPGFVPAAGGARRTWSHRALGLISGQVVLVSQLPSWTLHLSIVKMRRRASAQGAWSPQAAASTGLAHAEHCPSLPFYFPFSLCRPPPPTCPPPAPYLPASPILPHSRIPILAPAWGEPCVLLMQSPHLECPLSSTSFWVLAQMLTGPSSLSV